MQFAFLLIIFTANIFILNTSLLSFYNISFNNMPSMCAAIFCKSGYKSTATKHRMFQYPGRAKSPNRRRKCISAIKRGMDFNPGTIYYII